MNLADAAEKVLQAVGEQMHSAETIECARKTGWISPQGRTPDHSLKSVIWGDIKKNRSRSRFRMVGTGASQAEILASRPS
jgi:hypothetical protein